MLIGAPSARARPVPVQNSLSAQKSGTTALMLASACAFNWLSSSSSMARRPVEDERNDTAAGCITAVAAMASARRVTDGTTRP